MSIVMLIHVKQGKTETHHHDRHGNASGVSERGARRLYGRLDQIDRDLGIKPLA